MTDAERTLREVRDVLARSGGTSPSAPPPADVSQAAWGVADRLRDYLLRGRQLAGF